MDSIAPRLRSDLRLTDRTAELGRTKAVIKDPLLRGPAHGGFWFDPGEFLAALLLDGNRSPCQISLMSLLRLRPIGPKKVRVLIDLLDRAGLLDTPATRSAVAEKRRRLASEGFHRHDWVFDFLGSGPSSEIRRIWDGGPREPVFPERATALIVPHISSRRCLIDTASAYTAVRWDRAERIIVLAPNHVASLERQVIVTLLPFLTVLGSLVNVDEEAVRTLVAQHPGLFKCDDLVHSAEHSLAYHLPFISLAAGPSARVVPLLVPLAVNLSARARLGLYERIAQTLIRYSQLDNTVWVVSGDMYHHDGRPLGRSATSTGAYIRRSDQEMCRLIERGDYRSYLRQSMSRNDCLAAPLTVFMRAAGPRRAVRLTYWIPAETFRAGSPGTTYATFAVPACGPARN